MTTDPLPTGLSALTVFVEDVAAEADFHHQVLGLPVVATDDHSAVLRTGATYLNLLSAEQAGELVAPRPSAALGSTAQVMLSLWVDDLDAACATLRERGATLLNGPVDRPWGKRTVALSSPGGLVWEVAQDV
ncbi:VOC family protein [Pseudokineococcus sp. 5B2Z-1]|uniref:VOC family protein n=1 Tax=Pseudokineococcus sp. 5B2Z-1 TaxID=3132744 RepID=UPI00309489A8